MLRITPLTHTRLILLPVFPWIKDLPTPFTMGNRPGRLLGTWAMSLVDMPVNRRCSSNHLCPLEGLVARRLQRLSTAGPVTRDSPGAATLHDMVCIEYMGGTSSGYLIADTRLFL